MREVAAALTGESSAILVNRELTRNSQALNSRRHTHISATSRSTNRSSHSAGSLVVSEGQVKQNSSKLPRVRLSPSILLHRISYESFLNSGRWPEKSVKFMLRLLKNAESNADAKSLELEELYIKSIVVQQAPVRHVDWICSCISRQQILENSPPHISRAWSYQSLSGSSNTFGNHSRHKRYASREVQR
jgi:ribosomal protein L22